MDASLDASSLHNPNIVNHVFKSDHEPADIMNIMNITMRRFVVAAKMLPSFNEFSGDAKMALLRSKYIIIILL